MLCLWTPVSVLGRSDIVVLTVVEVLWGLRLCDAHEFLFQCWEDDRFHCHRGPVQVVQASFSTRNVLKPNFHICRGAAMLVDSCFSAENFMQMCFGARNVLIFTL